MIFVWVDVASLIETGQCFVI